jgi:hypothetical protein
MRLKHDFCDPCPNPSNYPKTQIKGETMTREKLFKLYLDWVNNYLTIEKFAEHHGLYVDEAKMLIDLSQKCFENNHPDY